MHGREMIRNLKDNKLDLLGDQEELSATPPTTTSCSSGPSSSFSPVAVVASEMMVTRNPRIVRASRLFGGKDRHSKVSTIRGLRDRRVRLSVPTAIQIYDLQDRLGLSQPSKVVDWLLNAAQTDIDKLPPLGFPPANPGDVAAATAMTTTSVAFDALNYEDLSGYNNNCHYEFEHLATETTIFHGSSFPIFLGSDHHEHHPSSSSNPYSNQNQIPPLAQNPYLIISNNQASQNPSIILLNSTSSRSTAPPFQPTAPPPAIPPSFEQMDLRTRVLHGMEEDDGLREVHGNPANSFM